MIQRTLMSSIQYLPDAFDFTPGTDPMCTARIDAGPVPGFI
jgi:hypothetical protein